MEFLRSTEVSHCARDRRRAASAETGFRPREQFETEKPTPRNWPRSEAKPKRTATRELTRCIAAGFYRMGIAIGKEKTRSNSGHESKKNAGFLHFASPLLVFAHHRCQKHLSATVGECHNVLRVPIGAEEGLVG